MPPPGEIALIVSAVASLLAALVSAGGFFIALANAKRSRANGAAIQTLAVSVDGRLSQLLEAREAVGLVKGEQKGAAAIVEFATAAGLANPPVAPAVAPKT